jgi:hypothetical protein
MYRGMVAEGYRCDFNELFSPFFFSFSFLSLSLGKILKILFIWFFISNLIIVLFIVICFAFDAYESLFFIQSHPWTFISFNLYIQFGSHYFYYYFFYFSLDLFIFFNFIPQYFILFYFCIQFWSPFFLLLFYPFLDLFIFF